MTAEERWAARRYWDTRGTSLGPRKLLWSNPRDTAAWSKINVGIGREVPFYLLTPILQEFMMTIHQNLKCNKQFNKLPEPETRNG